MSAERLLRAEDVAERIGMTKDFVYALVRRKEIPHVRLGRSVRFRRESIDAWLAEQEEANGRR